MKPKARFFSWTIRIVGAFILAIGMYSPALAADPPDLIVDKAHVGDFAQGDNNKEYTITVTNNGDGPTDGTLITLTDTLPTGLSAQTISSLDPAWTCPTVDVPSLTVLTCTRTTPLAAHTSSIITLIVDVAYDAGTGALIEDPPGTLTYYRTVTNTVNVTGGGDGDVSNIDTDETRILMKPDLRVIGYELRNETNTAPISSIEPNQSFWIRMTVENRGGGDTGNVYTSVFLDGDANYGLDHDEPTASPVPLILGEPTNFLDYHTTPAGGVNSAGCMYYDPSDEIDEVNDVVNNERGNYFVEDFILSMPAGTQDTADVFIGYPIDPPSPYFDEAIYGPVDDPIRNGLSAGSHTVYLYVDPNCNADGESVENNNSLGPIDLTVGSFSSGPTDIDVTIAGTSRGTYPMVPDTSMVARYPIDGGPVVISSDNGVGIIASLNQWRRPTASGGWTGVAQSMGLPVEQISNQYVIPRYNGTDPTLYDSVLMANVDNVPRTITVTIGGTLMGTYDLGPSESRYEKYPITGGPVIVSSVPGAKIVASLYELKRAGSSGQWNGQSEMMGLPTTLLSDKYLIPIYFGTFPLYLDASLAFANVDSFSTIVEVKVGGVTRGTYTMEPNTSRVVRYPVDGAVEISSNNGANIAASLNQWRRPTSTGGWTGVAQSMALPFEKISNQYVIPRYNGADLTLYNSVLMANVDTVPRTITVTIGGTLMGTYDLGPSESRYEKYDIVGGPIVVSSAVGAKIVASLYELKRAGTSGQWDSQTEMMGLPWSLLSDSYLIPIYFGSFPSYLDASLNIAVP